MTKLQDFAFLSVLPRLLPVAIAVYITIKTGFALWPFLRSSSLHKYQRRENASWALVTGATEGIGLAFAEELLQRGFDVIIHGRNPDKLERVKTALLQQNPDRSVKTWVADAAAAAGQINYESIVRLVQDSLPGELTVLINNVGGAPSPTYTNLEETTPDRIAELINLNASFPATLTSSLLPILKRNSPSAIMCCGSGASLVGMPYIVTYSATKAFVQAFCNSLATELSCSESEGKNRVDVSVHALLVGEVVTKANPAPPSFFVVQPNAFAAAALGKLGCEKVEVIGHWRHGLQRLILMMMPQWLTTRMVVQILTAKRAEEKRMFKAD